MVKIVGLLVKNIVNTYVSGHNCDFDYYDGEGVEYVLMCVEESENRFAPVKYEITLRTDYGECGSGWTTASFGFVDFRPVDHFRPFNYKPKNGVIEYPDLSMNELMKMGSFNEVPMLSYAGIHIPLEEPKSVFGFDYDGGDEYYPSGYAFVNMDYFEKLGRAMDKRPVWVFVGDSGLGKSTIADQLKYETIFETDSVDALPDVISASVIVLGNRSGFTLSDIKSRLFNDPEIILVNFAK